MPSVPEVLPRESKAEVSFIEAELGKASLPTAGAEKSVTLGTTGITRSVKAAAVGDGSKTKFVIKHELGTETLHVTATREEGTEGETTKPGPYVLVKEFFAKGANEVEVVFGSAPAKKEVYWVQIAG